MSGVRNGDPALSRAIALLAGALVLAACTAAGRAPLPERGALNPDLVQRGAMLFMDPRISGDRSRSCAGCHPGGGSTWEYYAGGGAAESEAAGARRVPPLRGLWQTPPYLWDGSLPTLEAAIGRMLDVEMRGGSLSEIDRRALEQYLLSIPPFDNGRVEPDGTPIEPVTLAARRGSAVFKKAGCDRCHVPPTFSGPSVVDIGTGGAWNVPSLRDLSSKQRYGHDGRWSDLESALRAELATHEIELTPQETHQLLRYLELL